MTSYRDMSDEALADLYTEAGDATRAAIITEMGRRDAKADRTRKDAARWAAVMEEWELYRHAQYLAACDATNGYLLSREGIAAGIDERDLWTGGQDRAMRYASEELREFWRANARLTPSQYREQQRREARARHGA